MSDETDLSEVPALIGDSAAKTRLHPEKVGFVPKQKEAEVVKFPGLINPFSVAPVWDTDVAALVVAVGAPLIVSVNCVEVFPFELSATLIVKLNEPTLEAIPDITPLLVFNVNPGGKAPDPTDQEYG
jgi:hypothetical protein